MSIIDVKRVAEQLDFLANHFVEDPWKVDEPGSDHEVTELTTKWYTKENKLRRRIKLSLRWLGTNESILHSLHYKGLELYKWRLRMFIYSLKKDKYSPDYSLRDGTVVAVWAETGDYLISVQPAVGDKVAKFLREDPTNPHAVEIATEIQKAWDTAFDDPENKTMYRETA